MFKGDWWLWCGNGIRIAMLLGLKNFPKQRARNFAQLPATDCGGSLVGLGRSANKRRQRDPLVLAEAQLQVWLGHEIEEASTLSVMKHNDGFMEYDKGDSKGNPNTHPNL